MRPCKTILLLHLAGQYPLAGVLWQALHYLVGCRQLGHDVYYVEDSGAPPYDPQAQSVVADPKRNVACLQQTLERFGFRDRWVYHDTAHDTYYGLSRLAARSLYDRADVILNLCGATLPREEHRGCGHLLYIDTDPVFEQIRAADGDQRTIDFLQRHDVCFTYGENLGAPDCPIPLTGCAWYKTRPPVVLDLWKPHIDPACRYFTTVATWQNKGKNVKFAGQTYRWSKHVNFRKFIDLPRRSPQAFELAVGAAASVRTELAALGWHLSDVIEHSATVDAYRQYIYASRGEFTVAKDIYVGPHSGWFSDRSVCYLAAGKPVITQETGFSKFIPTGSGLLAFSTMDEVIAALEAVNADYISHARAAREIAAEYFAADKVLAQLLRDAGV